MNGLEVSPKGRRYGLWRESPDHPARRLFAFPPMLPGATPRPAKADLSAFMGPIRDQGNEGSCTGQMGAAIRDLLYRKYFEFEKTKLADGAAYVASAGFIYLSNLVADGTLGNDVGSTIHQTIMTLNQKGACEQKLMPYEAGDVRVAPSPAQYGAAAAFRGGAYHFLSTLDDIRNSIASGYSVGFGIDVYQSFESDWDSTGFMPVPAQGENLLGGHAQHCLGYDDGLVFPDGLIGGLLIQNSWGSSWGISAAGRNDRGCYWMPYKFVLDGFVNDCWMIHLGPAWK